MRVLFNDDTWEFSNRRPLFFPKIDQAEDGSMTADEFRRFISRKVDGWDSKFVTGNVPEKCDVPFDMVDPSRSDFFAPPDTFR